MRIDRRFYEKLHSENEAYGMARYELGRLMGSKAFSAWTKRSQGAELRILDIGCGKGQFLLDLTRALQGQVGLRLQRVTGLDLVQADPNVFSKIKPEMEYIQASVEAEKLPFEDASFDLVCCNHVLEHIFETEHLLREIRRILTPSGLAVISVPNVAAWMNRIAFLFGGQPLGSEVGTETVTYGFWPPHMKKRLMQFSPSGHIRDFTPGGLKDLATACGFEHVGWWAQNGGVLIALNPKLGRNLGILLRPAGS